MKRPPQRPPPQQQEATREIPSPPLLPPQEIPQETKEITLSTEKYKITFTNKGAGIKELYLKYNDEEVLLLPSSDKFTHFEITSISKTSLPQRIWNMEATDNIVKFRTNLEGYIIEKQFQVPQDGYNIELKLTIQRELEDTEKSAANFLVFAGLAHDSPYRAENYLNAVIGSGGIQNQSIESVNPARVRNKSYPDGERISKPDFLWIAMKNRYFATFIRLKDEEIGKEKVKECLFSAPPPEVAEKIPNIFSSISLELPFKKGTRTFYDFIISGVPLRPEILNKQGLGSSQVIPVIGIGFINSFIVLLLKLFNFIFGNIGVAIIFTTLVIRLIILPLSIKSYVSSFKMQELQPKLNLLRQMYSKNPQKMYQEQRKLFKEHKVSPFTGCLVMLLQLPVFIGMYGVFETSLELRRSIFLWIKDLSQPDRISLLPFNIPLLGTNELNLLPIVMMICWVVQSALTMRKTDDPQVRTQQWLLLFMPLIFFFFIYGLASGLSLYFLSNSVFAIGEIKMVKKFIIKKK